MKKLKSSIAILLAFALVFTTACSSENVDNEEITTATADIMRLEKVEGDVVIKNSDGENIEPFVGMKLQSGYEVITGEESYAYISLDDSKAIKLDTSSASSIENDGKDLLITLTSGGLFFNVSQPLAEDETMNIKTSNMITGIRGTSGYIRAYEENGEILSTSSLITGTVGVHVLNEDGDKDGHGVIIVAGEEAVLNQTEEVLNVSEINSSEIPHFVKEAIDGDDDLQDEIEENDDFDLDDLVDDDKDDDFSDDDDDDNDLDDDSDDNDDLNDDTDDLDDVDDNQDDNDDLDDNQDDIQEQLEEQQEEQQEEIEEQEENDNDDEEDDD